MDARRRQPLLASGAALVGLLIGAGSLGPGAAAAADQSSGSRWSLPKPGLPYILTKPAKPVTELPPKEAAGACVTTAKDLLDHGYDREATLLFERARQLDSKRTDVSRFLAVLYDRQNDSSRAKVEFELAVKLTPKDPDLLNDYGYYYHRRDLAAAEHWYRAAIERSPKHPRAWVNLGMLLGEQHRYHEAFDAFSQVLTPGAAHSNVAMILARHGDRARAEQAARQALTLEPDLKQPQALLAFYEHGPQSPEAPAQTANASPPLRR